MDSPTRKGYVRLVGEVAYDDRRGKTELYWFEAPQRVAGHLSDSGNPWFVCLMPLAVTLGEPLRIAKPVDPLLLENARTLMRIWRAWYPHLRLVSVEAQPLGKAMEDSRRTAAFFSGGVDSFFTVLRHRPEAEEPAKPFVDDFLSVWGFDIPLTNDAAFERTRAALQQAAAELGKDLVDVATNIRTTRLDEAPWGYLCHGCALAAVALALEGRYGQALIASASHVGHDMTPWGTHPLTDPLLSTSRTRIIHDGAEFTRVEKTELVSTSEVAMRHLRVCWRSQSDMNCSACNKCYRTMTTLEVLGALERCTTFDRSGFNTRNIARVCTMPGEEVFLDEVRELAARENRMDVARAIGRSLRRSRRISWWLRLAGKLQAMRFMWRAGIRLERLARARAETLEEERQAADLPAGRRESTAW